VGGGLRQLLRLILRIPRPKISRDQALGFAKDACVAGGLAWEEPVVVSEGLKVFHVMTNAKHRGGNVNIRIDAQSGHVTSMVVAPR